MDCECLNGCLFFNNKMGTIPRTLELFKNSLCRGDSSQCARYMIFTALGKDKVPADLWPNDVERARTLLKP